ITAGGDHHRIEDDRDSPVKGFESIGDCPGDLFAREHADLDGGDRKIVQDCVNLRRYALRRNIPDTPDAEGVLRRHCGYRRGSEESEGLERLEIGLYPGTSAGIGPRNCHRHTHYLSLLPSDKELVESSKHSVQTLIHRRGSAADAGEPEGTGPEDCI